MFKCGKATPHDARGRSFAALARVTAALMCLGAAHAAAQPALVEANPELIGDDVLAPPAPEKPEGFQYRLTIGASVSVTSNENVVGQDDGWTTLLGLNLGTGLNYLSGAHDWKNTLTINETWTRTPSIDEFIKSNDLLELESLYKYWIWEWGGVFLRFNLQTPLFPSERVTAAPQTYVPADDPDADGETTDSFDLADPFEPLTITESGGLFAEPVKEKVFNLSLRGGVGGRHTLADGVLVIDDDSDANAVTYKRLEDVHQAGVELFAGATGASDDDRVTYNAGVTVLFPFINNDEQDRDAFDLTRIAAQAGVNVGIFEWMALNYQLRVIDDPQLVDDVQIQNALMLTFTYNVVEPAPEPPPDPNAEKLKAAEERAAAAEARAQAAEERAKAAEERAAEAGATGASTGTQMAPAAEPDQATETAPAPAPEPASETAPATEPEPTTETAPATEPAQDAAPAAP